LRYRAKGKERGREKKKEGGRGEEIYGDDVSSLELPFAKEAVSTSIFSGLTERKGKREREGKKREENTQWTTKELCNPLLISRSR